MTTLDDLELAPGAFDGAAMLRDDGYALVVVSNQACVGRGQLTVDALQAINDELNHRLGDAINGWFVCPHTAEAGCDCRKPLPGLVRDAQRVWGFDPASTWFVGDDDRDVEAALAGGCRPVLVRRGKGLAASGRWPSVPTFDDLRTFAMWRRELGA